MVLHVWKRPSDIVFKNGVIVSVACQSSQNSQYDLSFTYSFIDKNAIILHVPPFSSNFAVQLQSILDKN